MEIINARTGENTQHYPISHTYVSLGTVMFMRIRTCMLLSPLQIKERDLFLDLLSKVQVIIELVIIIPRYLLEIVQWLSSN